MLKLTEANRATVAAQAYARDHGYSISAIVCDSMAHGLAIIRRPGGLAIKRGKEVEDAIGVSGAPTDEQGEECAYRGIETTSHKRRSSESMSNYTDGKLLKIGALSVDSIAMDNNLLDTFSL